MKEIKLSEVSRMGSKDLFGALEDGQQTFIVIRGRGQAEDRKFEVTKTDEHKGAIRLNKFKLVVGNTLKALGVGESVIVGLPKLGAPRKEGDEDRELIKAYLVTAV